MAAPPQPVAAPRRLPQFLSIQYLRAIAALGVVVFHALEAAPLRFGMGAAGVDIFFVISGFIMFGLTEGAEARPGLFLWRRAARVAPMYWIATAVIAAIAVLRPNFMWMAPVTLDHLAKSLLFIPHYDLRGKIYPVVQQGWTLNYEMFFYLAFAAALFLPRRAQLPALTAAFALLAAIGLALRPANAAAATFTSPLLLEFVAGAWLGRAWAGGWARNRRLGLSLLALGAAALGAQAVLGLELVAWRAVAWGVPGLCLVAGAVMIEADGGAPCWRPLKALGDASYSIYLFHTPVVALSYRLFKHGLHGPRVAFVLAASAGAGWIAYRLVERPLTRALHKLPWPARPASPIPVEASVKAEPAASA
jgi:exopolysaccharide production protein ExoZ